MSETSRTYNRDSVAPNITPPSDASFNPYLNSLALSFTVSDPAPTSGMGTVTAQIEKADGTLVKTLDVTGGSSVTWDGTNNSNDYVNEGAYRLRITVNDGAANSTSDTSCDITLWDDQRITNNTADSNSPYLRGEGTWLGLSWIEGWDDTSVKVGPIEVPLETSSPYLGGATDASAISSNFTLDHDQNVDLYLWVGGAIETDRSDFSIMRASDGVSVWSKPNYKPYAGENTTAWISAGTYYLRVRVGAQGGGHTAQILMKLWHYDRKFNQYTCTSSDLGKNWESASGPEKVDSYPNPATEQTQIAKNGSNWHKIYLSTYTLYYQRSDNSGTSWSTAVSLNRLTNMCSNRSGTMYPTITYDSGNNAYVAWTDFRDAGVPAPQPGIDNYEIYFQKIPVNFAPVNGSVTAASVKVAKQTEAIAQATATLEAPVLIAPKDENDPGYKDLTSLRPTFTWQHHKGETQNYQLDIAKNDTFTDDHRSFTRSENTGSLVSKTDPTYFNYNYAIHEFDPGLDPDTDYFWKVTALSTTEAATSETWSFKIAPDLTLTGITNYPNPFNPNRERTKIRYRLGADADEVKIRIYDITGSLVTELRGDTFGEKSNIWQKYNDVEWNGTNGRGSKVVNGIYPYEVVARLGGRSVSGRGKIAVLK
jgi:flagellar hook assembly protein FlgD